MSTTTTLIPVPKLLKGSTISYHPKPPQKVPNPSHLGSVCPVPPLELSVFKQSDGVLTGSFSLQLNAPGTLTMKAGYFSNAPSTVYILVSYNGAVSSGEVYVTTADVVIPTVENVTYTTILIYLNNQNGEGACPQPKFPFGDIQEETGGPPTSGTTSAGTSTTVQKDDDDGAGY
jgi:hypothetical protein